MATPKPPSMASPAIHQKETSQGHPGQLQRRGAGLAPCRLAQADHRVDEPERRPEADVQQRGGVDAAHQGHDDGEPGAVPPAPPAHGQCGERHQPREPGPGEQQDRDPPHVLQEVRGEHVGERGHERPQAPEREGPAQEEDARPGGEQDRADPQALGHPHRDPDGVEEPEEGAHREQVADLLVGDRPEADGRVPHGGGRRDEAVDVEVEVGLGVRAHHPGLGHQLGHVGRQGQQQMGGPRPPPPEHAGLARPGTGFPRRPAPPGDGWPTAPPAVPRSVVTPAGLTQLLVRLPAAAHCRHPRPDPGVTLAARSARSSWWSPRLGLLRAEGLRA